MGNRTLSDERLEGEDGSGKKRKHNISDCTGKQTSLNSNESKSPKMTLARIKFNVIEVIVQMYMLNDP